MLVALALSAALSSPGVLVDRVVAVVDREVITQSELILEARLTLAQRTGERAATAKLDDAFVAGYLDYLINQHLVAGQAQRLGFSAISDETVTEEISRLQEQFRSPTSFRAFLRRFGISDDRLAAFVRRELTNGRYVQKRMRARLMGAELAPDSSEYQESLARWLDELRETTEVRLLSPNGRLTVRDRVR